MNRIAIFILGLFFTLASVLSVSARDQGTPEEAGKSATAWTTVCGKVAQIAHVPQMTNKPTFIYLDEPFPHQVFEIVIWGDARNTFSRAPEVLYSGKKVCVAGVDRNFQGIPEIVVDQQSQITVMPDKE